MDKITTYNNRGMLLEKIINNSINFYINNNIAYFKKNNLDVKFKSIKGNKLEDAHIYLKSTVDYYGIYKGRFISFEAKSTESDSFSLSNIKSHQHNHLMMINNFGGWAFYIIFFKKFNEIFIVNAIDIDKFSGKTISQNEIKKIGKRLEIIFPGIIDFLSIYEEN